MCVYSLACSLLFMYVRFFCWFLQSDQTFALSGTIVRMCFRHYFLIWPTYTQCHVMCVVCVLSYVIHVSVPFKYVLSI